MRASVTATELLNSIPIQRQLTNSEEGLTGIYNGVENTMRTKNKNTNVIKINNNTFSSRLLGHFVPAAKDLRMACKLDFDEIADEWLKEVTPNVSTFSFFVLRLKVGIS